MKRITTTRYSSLDITTLHICIEILLSGIWVMESNYYNVIKTVQIDNELFIDYYENYDTVKQIKIQL